jgi:drug/metabolite transporter (DMT)-like permease
VRTESGVVLTIGIIAVSTASIFIRYAQAEAPSLVIATYRMAVASVVLAPLAWHRYRAELRSLLATEWRLAAGAGIFLALHFATWVTSLEYTSVASSVVLLSTSPLWVAMAAWLFLRERLTLPVAFGLIIALGGGLIIGLNDTQHGAGRAPLLGDALALIGALMLTGYWLVGRRVRVGASLVPYVAVVYTVATVVLLTTSTVARQSLVGYQPVIYLWFVLLGLVPQLIGHSSFNWALAYMPATFVAIATLGEPIGSTLLAYVLLSETPSLLKIFGAALILAGIGVTLSSQAYGGTGL